MSYFDTFVAANEGREGKRPVYPGGASIECSMYLGNGKYITEKRDGSFELVAVNHLGDGVTALRLGKEAIGMMAEFAS